MTEHQNKRRIILDLAVTLDGFIEGKHGEIDWCIMDPEMEFHTFLNDIDTILYGRKSYELWGKFTPEIINREEAVFWESVHSKEKYVFSRAEKTPGEGAVFIRENIFEEMQNLKNRPGKDIWLYGGAGLIKTFLSLDLVDEFRLSVHPVILGGGKLLFEDIRTPINLKLIRTRTFTSGVVQLIYHRFTKVG